MKTDKIIENDIKEEIEHYNLRERMSELNEKKDELTKLEEELEQKKAKLKAEGALSTKKSKIELEIREKKLQIKKIKSQINKMEKNIQKTENSIVRYLLARLQFSHRKSLKEILEVCLAGIQYTYFGNPNSSKERRIIDMTMQNSDVEMWFVSGFCRLYDTRGKEPDSEEEYNNILNKLYNSLYNSIGVDNKSNTQNVLSSFIRTNHRLPSNDELKQEIERDKSHVKRYKIIVSSKSKLEIRGFERI